MRTGERFAAAHPQDARGVGGIGESGRQCRCIELSELIRVKRAAGRPKDYEAIAELEKLEELGRGP